MSNEISLLPTDQEFKIIGAIAKSASKTKFIASLGGEDAVFSIALYCREAGIPIMQGIFGGIQNIQGKLTVAPEMMLSRIRTAGHRVEALEATGTVCRMKGTRADTGETMTCSFTIEEARIAGLVKPGGAWEKYAQDMLWARCLSRLRRRLFTDILTKMYVEGELDEIQPAPIPAPAQNDPIKNPVIIDVPKSPEEEVSAPIPSTEKARETFGVPSITELSEKHLIEHAVKKLGNNIDAYIADLCQMLGERCVPRREASRPSHLPQTMTADFVKEVEKAAAVRKETPTVVTEDVIDF